MPKNDSTLFTIGQFADLHGINKKTLMWYDQVGVFRPAVVKENNYRYYTYHQSTTLETILMLRELNVSIKEIQSYMANRSAESLRVLLEEKITELDRTIAHLKGIRRTLVRRRDDAAALLTLDLSEISVVERQREYLAVVDTSKDVPFEKDAEMVIAETKKQRLHRLYDASYGSMISADRLYEGAFEDYSGLFIQITGPSDRKKLHLRPEGKYLRAYCKGSWDNLPLRYKELLEYAGNHGLFLHGFAYETGINETSIHSMEEYITKIEVGVYSR